MSRGVISGIIICCYAVSVIGVSLLIGVTLGIIAQWAFFPFSIAAGLLLGLRLGKWAAS